MQIMDVGWPELHAPPLDKMCTICKAQESWLNSDPQHVVVIHCRVSVPTPTGSAVPEGSLAHAWIKIRLATGTSLFSSKPTSFQDICHLV